MIDAVVIVSGVTLLLLLFALTLSNVRRQLPEPIIYRHRVLHRVLDPVIPWAVDCTGCPDGDEYACVVRDCLTEDEALRAWHVHAHQRHDVPLPTDWSGLGEVR